MLGDVFYPRGGWSRAVSYIAHRVRRLPDPPHRIARGISVGVFVCFTPLYGLHFLLAAFVTWVMRGNVVAALLATFFGNPITFPIIAALSLRLGFWMLGIEGEMAMPEVFEAFSEASQQLWYNFLAMFTSSEAHWDQLSRFGKNVFWPYFVGGLIPGTIAGVSAYMLARPAVSAYQKARIKRLKARYNKRSEAASTDS